MRSRQKREVSSLILSSSCHPPKFTRCSFFLPNLVFLMGSQRSYSDTAESLLHPELEPDVPPPSTSILRPLRFHLGLAPLPKIVPRFRRMAEKKHYLAFGKLFGTWSLKSWVLIWSLDEVCLVTEIHWQEWGLKGPLGSFSFSVTCLKVFWQSYIYQEHPGKSTDLSQPLTRSGWHS